MRTSQVSCDKERAEFESEAVALPLNLCSHLRPQALGNDQKKEFVDVGNQKWLTLGDDMSSDIIRDSKESWCY